MALVAEQLHGSSYFAEFEKAKHKDEEAAVKLLLANLSLSAQQRNLISDRAGKFVVSARANKQDRGTLDTFLQEFGLSNQEGIALMCLAEALLRVPDGETADRLIAEKIKSGNWSEHSGKSESLLVNASTWGLMLTGRVISLAPNLHQNVGDYMKTMVTKSGEPVIRAAMMQAMRIMGEQFVLGRTISGAMKRAEKLSGNLLYSFDMLGEGARTDEDACRYFESYYQAIEDIGQRAGGRGIYDGPGISVKISALHARYEFAQNEKSFETIYGRLLELAKRAAHFKIGFTIDAEEADRLAFSLDLLEALCHAPELSGWNGLGLAVQAYQKRTYEMLDWLIDLGRRSGRRLMVRLVKGAYWDTEIKHAQQMGFEDYPVFTTKSATDVSYLACAEKIFTAPKEIYPQFATHNAHTLAAITHIAGEATDYEFQRLHGMGDLLYKSAGETIGNSMRCRIYAPVGSHEDLLPYLVRRLLENGANSSFVHSFLDESVAVEEVVRDPMAAFEGDAHWRHPQIPLPRDIFAPTRKNSNGLDLSDAATLAGLSGGVHIAYEKDWQAGDGISKPVVNPSNLSAPAGTVANATAASCSEAFAKAAVAQPDWNAIGGNARADILDRCAQALEENRDLLIGLLCREAGKTLGDGVDEVREAVDFCRYYAVQSREKFSGAMRLPGPTGETNDLILEGRGTFVCISPWNFPLAIFTGQIMAALAAGNAVLAKPAEQTPLIAAEAVRLFHESGMPKDILQLILGDGAAVGAALVEDARTSGVAFTGSTDTAQRINRSLAAKPGAIVPLIAETGGLNGMFVDSTALIEQVTDDVIRSAFGSAGQRCSALRILFVQEDIADKTIATLKGAMDELVVGDPQNIVTDVGPIIDAPASELLTAHIDNMKTRAALLHQVKLPKECERGTFFAPALIEITSLDVLEREVFGPILHIMRYDPRNLDALLSELRRKDFGLTLGVHSRLQSFANQIYAGMPAGNTYINRDIIGATVGVQPFGGRGLSGTGPKAGGPHYLMRFANERVRTENITAQGGNAALFCLDPERSDDA